MYLANPLAGAAGKTVTSLAPFFYLCDMRRLVRSAHKIRGAEWRSEPFFYALLKKRRKKGIGAFF